MKIISNTMAKLFLLLIITVYPLCASSQYGVKANFGIKCKILSGLDSSGNGVLNNDGTPKLYQYKWTAHTKDGVGSGGDNTVFCSNARASTSPRNWTIASFTTSSLFGGNHTITAVYSGDMNYYGVLLQQLHKL